MAYRIVHSKWGRVFKAIRDNVEAVEASGINIAEMKILAFTLAKMCIRDRPEGYQQMQKRTV